MFKKIPQWVRDLLPTNTTSSFFSSSLGEIHYLSRGIGRQIVLLHGNPTWSFLWRKVMNELSETEFEILAPDLMNLGYSADLAGVDFRIEKHVQYLAEFFTAKVRKDAILVVQDWGGPLGLLAASRCHDLFSGYVILNTGVQAPKLPVRISWFHRFSQIPLLSDFVFGVLGFPLYTLNRVQGDKNSIVGKTASAYRAPIHFGRRRSALKFARMVPSSENHPSYEWFLKLGDFSKTLTNVEIVWGIKDPILGKQSKRVQKALPNARYTEVNAGHFLQEEAFVEIAAAIRRLC